MSEREERLVCAVRKFCEYDRDYMSDDSLMYPDYLAYGISLLRDALIPYDEPAKATEEESPLSQLKRIADALEKLVAMYRVVR